MLVAYFSWLICRVVPQQSVYIYHILLIILTNWLIFQRSIGHKSLLLFSILLNIISPGSFILDCQLLYVTWWTIHDLSPHVLIKRWLWCWTLNFMSPFWAIVTCRTFWMELRGNGFCHIKHYPLLCRSLLSLAACYRRCTHVGKFWGRRNHGNSVEMKTWPVRKDEPHGWNRVLVGLKLVIVLVLVR
jgi:hypothetical protein